MKLAIIGSREYPHPEKVVAFVNALPEGTIVVSGDGRGPDRKEKP